MEFNPQGKRVDELEGRYREYITIVGAREVRRFLADAVDLKNIVVY